MKIAQQKYIDIQESFTYEVTVRQFEHPKEGTLYATFRDWTLLSVIGKDGPVEFQIYPDGDHFSVGDFVTPTENDSFIKRG